MSPGKHPDKGETSDLSRQDTYKRAVLPEKTKNQTPQSMTPDTNRWVIP